MWLPEPRIPFHRPFLFKSAQLWTSNYSTSMETILEKGSFEKLPRNPHVTIDICRWKLLTAERSCFYPDGPSRSPDWDVLWWRLWPRNPFGDLKCQTKIILLLSKLVWMDIKCKCCQDLIVFMLDKSKDRKMDWASWLVSYYQFSQSHFPSRHWLVW